MIRNMYKKEYIVYHCVEEIQGESEEYNDVRIMMEYDNVRVKENTVQHRSSVSYLVVQKMHYMVLILAYSAPADQKNHKNTRSRTSYISTYIRKHYRLYKLSYRMHLFIIF